MKNIYQQRIKKANFAKISTKLKLSLNKLGTNFALRVLSYQNKEHSARSTYDIFYTNKTNPKQSFDLHLPLKNRDKFPVVFYIHGGAWAGGDKSGYTEFCQKFAKMGFAVVNINFRLLPDVNILDVYKDCENAINYALNNSTKLSLDLNNIFMIGDSAGAHLIALITAKSIQQKKPFYDKIRGLGLYYGVYDLRDLKNTHSNVLKLMNEYFSSVFTDNIDDFYKDFSPVCFINKNFPPCFLTCGTADGLYEYSIQFSEFLNKKNIENETLFFNTKLAIHGFLNLSKRRCASNAFKHIVAFFNNHKK